MKLEGQRIVDEGSKRGLHLRVLGAIAFQLHCPKYSFLTTRLNRVLSDVDFAAYYKEFAGIVKMMRELGYKDEPMVTALWGEKRTIWDHENNGVHVDIFFNGLEMNHDVPFKDRLDIDPLTISLADMLLEKMQIVHINEKDIVDTIMLLREHEIGGPAPETIDATYIAKLLSGDWGFYYTFTTNLRKIQESLPKYEELSNEDRENVTAKVQKLLKIVEDQSKSMGWKVRAKVGPKSKWYRDVEEVRR
jgi:hypothetical protein